MCDLAPDPRDEIAWSARALRGISDLVAEVGQSKQQFERVGPAGLAELLNMVDERLYAAAQAISDYVPRA